MEKKLDVCIQTVDIKINGEKKTAKAITPIEAKKLTRIGEQHRMIFFKDEQENYFVLFV